MTKIIITGFSGFVSKNFVDYIDSLGEDFEVLGIDITGPEFDITSFTHLNCSFKNIDLLNKDELSQTLNQFRPKYILHLASFSSVSYSWQNPITSFVNNTNIFLNLVEQIRKLKLDCRLLSVGSSEEYGKVSSEHLPIKETQILSPNSPYAVARVSQEMLTKVFVDGYGLDIVLTRSFNHIGPGQKDIFAVSSFAKQIANLKKQGNIKNIINVGDISIVRDFIDVRDVVKAYYLLFIYGRKGEVYNICSGKGISLKDVIYKLAEINELELEVNVDESLLRPIDNQVIIGDNSKLKLETNWSIDVTLEKSLLDISNYWLNVY